ncbi:TRAP transporter substrate-binding protein [Thalassobaculum sp. OXR-137]|uniref:TRAP transporter substrate-binding protein n=1 Tax=Thalassobaculum sp. OXR-137 TaxID=3100173 RepID=UPI002AC917E6|nr:TRAP transporter substrate-binding protein [Thalassobaculum sp. OXR-137]WPZ32480.1 TRAP transporter substrate-binding protein [Thalassobaculum sp. OXR-137]
MKKTLSALGGALISLGLMASPASAELDQMNLKVVGTWGNLSNWKVNESPFWNDTMPSASGGKITANAVAQTDVGIKGFEVVRMLKIGVFDVAHGVVGYIAGEDPIVEGVDLAGVIQNWADAKASMDAYRPIIARQFEETYGAKLMALYPFPSQMLWCNADVNSAEDLAGKKVRVYTTSMGDLIEGLNATSVTIAFAEVVPALEKKVVDCGITGTMPAYQAKWWQIATHAYLMKVGYTATFAAINLTTWNRMNDETKAFFEKQFAEFEKTAWDNTMAEDEMGIICNTGVGGKCTEGEAGGMKKVEPSAADDAKRKQILETIVLKRWAERCVEKFGAKCIDDWNATIGKVAGVQAPKP